jgi:hypothetical protein
MDGLLGERFLEGKVSVSKWARNRRQRIVRDISFDSDVHNIYEPVFSSEGSRDFVEEDEVSEILH